ncbi:MurR/RpiR family transcriptional regulator [Microbacterium sp. AGC85]
MATDAAARMLRQDATNIASVASETNVDAIRNIARAISASRRTVVLTSGSGAGPAHVLGYIASIYGYDVRVAAGSATSQTVIVSQLGSEDCLVVINVWRLTRALRGLTRLGRERGANVAVLTDLHSSPLNSHADNVVITPIGGVDETPSLTAMLAVVQAILAELSVLTPRNTAGQIERSWEALDLMDDQA